MFGKRFASFFLLSLVTTQAAANINFNTNERDQYEINNFISWSDIIDKIKDFLKMVQEIVSLVTSDLKKTFEQMKAKIIGSIASASDISNKIMESLQKLAGNVGDVKDCLDKQKPRVIATEQYSDKAQTKLHSIEESANAVRQAISKLMSDTTLTAEECIVYADNKPLCLTQIILTLMRLIEGGDNKSMGF